ncbi:MAG: hypothetical protein ACT4RN_20385 [Pseudonocardia sp.]
MRFAHTEFAGRRIVVGPPKSRAGVRTVAIPRPSAWQDDMRAALIYQRAPSEANRLMTDRLSALVVEHREQPEDPDDEDDDGAAGSLVRRGSCGAGAGAGPRADRQPRIGGDSL